MNRAGMTLVELLVAIVVAGLVLSAAYGAYGAVTDVNQRTQRDYRALQQQVLVRQSLAEWLAAAEWDSVAPAWTVIEGRYDDQSDDRVGMLVTRAEPFVAARSAIVLRIDRDPLTPEAGLVAEITPVQHGERRRIELVRYATDLDVAQLVEWDGRMQWVSMDTSPFAPHPRAIRLRIGGLNVPSLLQIPVIVTRLP